MSIDLNFRGKLWKWSPVRPSREIRLLLFLFCCFGTRIDPGFATGAAIVFAAVCCRSDQMLPNADLPFVNLGQIQFQLTAAHSLPRTPHRLIVPIPLRQGKSPKDLCREVMSEILPFIDVVRAIAIAVAIAPRRVLLAPACSDHACSVHVCRLSATKRTATTCSVSKPAKRTCTRARLRLHDTPTSLARLVARQSGFVLLTW